MIGGGVIGDGSVLYRKPFRSEIDLGYERLDGREGDNNFCGRDRSNKGLSEEATSLGTIFK